MTKRPQIDPQEITAVLVDLGSSINDRQEEKGHSIYNTSHETLGIISEEFDEYKEAVHLNEQKHQYDELMDIAVACIIAMASLKSGKMEWA